MTTKTPAKSPRNGKAPKSGAAPPAETTEQSLSLAPETLARTLRAVAAELERDPALARRVAAAVDSSAGSRDTVKSGKDARGGRSRTAADLSHEDDVPVAPSPKVAKVTKPRPFVPRLITGTSPELGTGVPDPFALYRRLGADGLRAALDDLRLGTLRAIVREYTLDPSGRLGGLNDAERLRVAILDAAREA